MKDLFMVRKIKFSSEYFEEVIDWFRNFQSGNYVVNSNWDSGRRDNEADGAVKAAVESEGRRKQQEEPLKEGKE